MAAGFIQGTVTTTTGETIEMSFLVDDTGTPTKWFPVRHSVKSDGTSDTSIATLVTSLTNGDQATVIVDGTNTEVTFEPSVAHDAADAGNPTKIGFRAIAHGANPTAVAANDRTNWYSNRHGIPWVIGGHPNVVSRSNIIADSDGAQTDASLAGAIGAGTKVVLTQLSVQAGANCTANLRIRVGFGTANVPTPALAGVNGLPIDGTFAPGSGIQKGNGAGIVAIGGDGEELRITCDDPVGGNIFVSYSYYTIES